MGSILNFIKKVNEFKQQCEEQDRNSIENKRHHLGYFIVD
jgi:hypothetical protein